MAAARSFISTVFGLHKTYLDGQIMQKYEPNVSYIATMMLVDLEVDSIDT